MFTVKNDLLLKDGVPVLFKDTPNHAGKFVPRYIINHFTAATEAAGSISWFMSPASQVSAHLLIDRAGVVIQFAPFNVVCWHAGVSVWKDIRGLNSHAIGIEFVNGGLLERSGSAFICPVDKKVVNDIVSAKNKRGMPGVWQKFTDAQIEAGVQVCDAIKAAYEIKEVLGHEDIAPGRKVDPGPAFPWDRFTWGPVTSNVSRETVNDVNIRKGPGTSYESIKVLPKGQKVKFVRSESGWSFVEVINTLPGPIVIGWIRSDLIN